jgi:molybdenum cofactor cytidylyltransferase
MIVAIVPAAGLSRRMGRPKPLLDVGGMTLVARVVSALRDGGADRVIVVAPPAERVESAGIVREAEAQGAEVVVLDRETADMRASIETGMERAGGLDDVEAILLAPADVPGIEAELVARVIDAGRKAFAMARPRSGAKRGHPVYLPRDVAREIPGLPEGVGVNALVDGLGRTVVEVQVEDGDSLGDVDTPEEYRRWSAAEASPPGDRV